MQQLVAELQLPLLACAPRPLPRGRDCISHPWFSSKCCMRLGACTRAPERPCLCGVYGLVQVTGSKQMTHKYIYDHEMRQGPGMIRTVCWGQNSRTTSFRWAVPEQVVVDGMRLPHLLSSLELGAGGGRDRGPSPLTSHLMSGVQRGERPLPFRGTLHPGRETEPHPR